MALCDFSNQLAVALWSRQAQLGFESRNQSAWNEALEWMTLFWKENPMVGMLAALSELSTDTVDRLIDWFCLDFRRHPVDIKGAADGYFPPFIRLTGCILLVPDFALAFLQSRNLLYILQRKDPKAFNTGLSHALEPQLIRTAQQVLEPLGFVIKTNYIWASGEIDLLIYDANTNTAAHCQAKAPLSPQGARMVERLESRLKEGLDQLKQVRDLSASKRDELIGSALGRRVAGVNVRDILLARSCFGTVKTREAGFGIQLLSLPVLARITAEIKFDSKLCSLPEFLDKCSAYSAALPEKAGAEWVIRELQLNDVRIRVPCSNTTTHSLMLSASLHGNISHR
jgi:hypothetical protein